MKTDLVNEWRTALQNGKYPIMKDWVRKLYLAVLDKYAPYISDFTEVSGSTTIYPLETWRYEFTTLLNTKDKRHFPQKGLDEIVCCFSELKRAYFKENDESYPAELVFEFKEGLW